MSQPKTTRRTTPAREEDDTASPMAGEPKISDIMKELSKMQTKNDKAKKQANDHLDTIAKQITTHIEESEKSAIEIIKKITDLAADLRKEVAEKEAFLAELQSVKRKCSHLEVKIERQEKRLDSMDEERRRLNLIIDGIPENDTKNIKTTIGELFRDLDLSFQLSDTITVYRMGAKTTTGRPRSVMVRLNSPLQKAEIYRNVSKLAKNRTWKGVNLNDDLPPSQQAERRDTRSLIALARSKGLASKQKGSAVIIEGVRYPPRDFPALPHGLSLEAAKTVQVTGGLAFQGHHSYLSNMYITPVPYSGNTFDSAESAYQCTCAKFHGNEALAAQRPICCKEIVPKNSVQRRMERKEDINHEGYCKGQV